MKRIIPRSAILAHRTRDFAVCAIAALALAGSAAADNTFVGPSTSVPPYYKPLGGAAAAGYTVSTLSILTVADPVVPNIGGYKMVGIPDGLGLMDNGNGTFTLLMNHELRGGNLPGGVPTQQLVTNATTGVVTTNLINAALGVTRAYGGKGAFVSQWTFATSNLQALAGADLAQTLYVWDTNTAGFRVFNPANDYHMSRLCAADLAPVSAFYNPVSGLGTTNRLFLNGEEDTGRPGQGARAFAHVASGPDKGKSYELLWFGKYAWENVVASPYPQNLTLVAGLEDNGQTNSQVYFYIGAKQATGLDIDKAGLGYGVKYAVRVDVAGTYLPLESNTNVFGVTNKITTANFTLAPLGDVAHLTADELETLTVTNATSFQRVEDGAWDPTKPEDFYFVTTGGISGSGIVNASRLWRLRFNSITNPTAGGTMEMLLEGAPGQNAITGEQPVMMDNLCMLANGRILIQEDPGNSDRLARIWLFDPVTRALVALAGSDPKYFATGGAAFLTRDEESSGIIDAQQVLGPGWVLLVVQPHYSIAGELAEGGQLIAMHIAQTPLVKASTSVEPYYKPSVVPAANGGYHVATYSLLTVNDTNKPDVNGYRMVGIPDGLGAFDNGNGTFTLLINHELRGGDLPGGNGTLTYTTNTGTGVITTNNNAAQGVVRAYGGKGSFVSKWVIEKTNLTVLSGGDLMKTNGLMVWDNLSYSFRPFNPVTDHHLSRLCSADLAPVTAFYNPYNGKGTTERLFLNGEEDGGTFRPGQGGRAFAHIATGPEAGTSYELPYYGLYAWENVVASPAIQDKTVVIGLDDSDLTNSQVYVHIGMKSSTGSIIEKAGLHAALTYGIRVEDNGVFVPLETNDRVLGSASRKAIASFQLHNLGYITNVSHAQLDVLSFPHVTSFQRVEDGAWDPIRPGDFYFLTTGRASGANVTSASRLWRLSFDDITRPELGGFIELVLDGPAGDGLANSHQQPVMMDNLCFLKDGRLLIQEDPGNNDRLAKIWIFDPWTSALTELAAADAKYFSTGGAAFLTRDEEASGIMDMEDILGPGWVLYDTQVHSPLGGDLVERGQLNAMHISQVRAFPSVQVGPQTQTVGIGATVTLSVTPAGTGPFTYQWLFNGAPVVGANQSALTLYNLPLNQAGSQFAVTITGPEGSVTSAPATVKVNPVAPALPSLVMYPGVSITGTPGANYRIEYATALGGGTNWQTLTNLVLPSSPYLFLDLTGANQSARFYRAAIP